MINSKVTNIKNIRKNSIPYMITWIIFYGWMISFFTWWSNDFDNNLIFETKQMYIINALLFLFIAIFVFFIKPNNYKKNIMYGEILAIIDLIIYGIFLYIPSFVLGKKLLFLLPIFMGAIYAGLLNCFIYIMNNSEKFYAIILSNFFVTFFALLHYLCGVNIFNNYILLVILLIAAIIPTFKYNVNDYFEEEKKYAKTAPKITGILYLSLIINCVFLIFCRGVGRALLLITNETFIYNLEIFYYIGGMIGCIFIFLLYTYVKRCNSIAWNVIFGTFTFAIFLYAFSELEIIRKIYAFLLGTSITMGMSSMYYILGVISKKYWNYSYVKYNVLIIDILGCCFGATLGNYIYNVNSSLLTNIVLIISILIMIVSLIVSPILIITFFNDKWDEDSRKALIDNLNVRKFMKYHLTNKEIEVCNYLLDNLTVRQIAANMNISENTVKFHKKQIFDKLNISSKDELFKILK